VASHVSRRQLPSQYQQVEVGAYRMKASKLRRRLHCASDVTGAEFDFVP
jgi:hypothetical protein